MPGSVRAPAAPVMWKYSASEVRFGARSDSRETGTMNGATFARDDKGRHAPFLVRGESVYFKVHDGSVERRISAYFVKK